jgi:hypothetical protein
MLVDVQISLQFPTRVWPERVGRPPVYLSVANLSSRFSKLQRGKLPDYICVLTPGPLYEIEIKKKGR